MAYSFSIALDHAKGGGKIRRANWNGPNQYVYLQNVAYEHMASYLVICTTQKMLVPWVPSQTDLLATDWELLAPETTPLTQTR